MMKRLGAALVLMAVVLAGASAQFMFGASGTVLTDQEITPEFVQAVIDSGEAWYGGFAELGLGKLAIGVSANMSSPYPNAVTEYEMENAAINTYLAFHIFGTKAFLDPFVEGGFGVIANRYTEEQNQLEMQNGLDFLTASMYWYAGAGAGINLGPIGVFGKLTYNKIMAQPLPWEKEDGTTGDYAPFDPFGTGAAFGFTLGAKLIL